MAYTRKTTDEYQVEGFYFGEWCVECVESSYRNALATIKVYREECKSTAFRIVKKRVLNVA